jgi:hypothetical protein
VRWTWLVALSIVCGLGFYTYINWAVVWLCITLFLLFRREETPLKVAFLSITFLLGSPLFWARFQPGALDLLKSDFSPSTFFSSIPLYLRGVLWNGSPGYPLGPLNSGLLDPVTGSLMMIGLLWVLGTFSGIWILGITLGLSISFLPGTLTSGLELQRITPAIPWLLGMASIGFFCLTRFARKWERPAWFLLLLAPLSINTYSFLGPYCNPTLAPPNQQWRSLVSSHAYQILEHESELNGPLNVFSEFNIFYDDKTLNLACYPFDALQNPKLKGQLPQEVALLLNVHYSPFLQARFPSLRYERLNPDSSLGLYLIPTTQIPPSTLRLWCEADGIYRDVNYAIKNKSPLQKWDNFLISFENLRLIDRSDPLLMSIYWEKVAFFNDLMCDFPGAAEAYQKATQEGYPASHLFFDRGTALKYSGRIEESKKAFKKAEEILKRPGA